MRRAWRDLSYEAMAESAGLILCTDPVTCRQHWGEPTHYAGKRDRYGYIHWSRAGRVSEQGLYAFCKLIAEARLPGDTMPSWLRTYRVSTTAVKIARFEFGRRVFLDTTMADRRRARRQAIGHRARTDHRVAYNWMRKYDQPVA